MWTFIFYQNCTSGVTSPPLQCKICTLVKMLTIMDVPLIVFCLLFTLQVHVGMVRWSLLRPSLSAGIIMHLLSPTQVYLQICAGRYFVSCVNGCTQIQKNGAVMVDLLVVLWWQWSVHLWHFQVENCSLWMRLCTLNWYWACIVSEYHIVSV